MKRVFYLFIASFVFTIRAQSQCACCAGAGTGSSNGDYNSGILTLKKNQFVLEGYADYRTIRNGDGHHHEPVDSTAEEETPLKSILVNSIGVRFGVTNKLTVSALLPYAFLYTKQGNDKGIGDLILLGTYQVFSTNGLNCAIQAGIELPTGIQKGSNFDNTTVVVGSGSVDPIAGIMVSKIWDKLSFRGNVLYKHTTKGFEKNYYGSISVQNLSLAYRVKGEGGFCTADSLDHPGHTDFSMTVFGGYYGEWLDKVEENKIVDQHSGYYLGFASLGTNLSYKKWSIPLTFSLPLFQLLNGHQNHAGFRLRLGIIKSF